MPTEGERVRLEAELRQAERDHGLSMTAHRRALDALDAANGTVIRAEKARATATEAAEACGEIRSRAAERVRALREALGLNKEA